MKNFLAVVWILCLAFALIACGAGTKQMENKPNENETEQSNGEFMNREMSLRIGQTERFVLLYENETARAFIERLPATLRMEAMEHEKYAYLPYPMPSNAEAVGRIEAGDLMLWGNNCLVFFYESFDTSYRYTPIGKVTDAEGLAAALPSGGVTISFTLKEKSE